MPDEPRVQELLAELLDREATPEEVCGACPELLPVIRERWRQICRARSELDALLPIWPHGSPPTMPPWCATSTASASVASSPAACRAGCGVPDNFWARVPPSTSSIVR